MGWTWYLGLFKALENISKFHKYPWLSIKFRHTRTMSALGLIVVQQETNLLKWKFNMIGYKDTIKVYDDQTILDANNKGLWNSWSYIYVHINLLIIGKISECLQFCILGERWDSASVKKIECQQQAEGRSLKQFFFQFISRTLFIACYNLKYVVVDDYYWIPVPNIFYFIKQILILY